MADVVAEIVSDTVSVVDVAVRVAVIRCDAIVCVPAAMCSVVWMLRLADISNVVEPEPINCAWEYSPSKYRECFIQALLKDSFAKFKTVSLSLCMKLLNTQNTIQ